MKHIVLIGFFSLLVSGCTTEVETAKKPVSYSESKPKGFGHTMSSIPSPRISKLDEVPTAQWGRKSSDFLKSELSLK